MTTRLLDIRPGHHAEQSSARMHIVDRRHAAADEHEDNGSIVDGYLEASHDAGNIGIRLRRANRTVAIPIELGHYVSGEIRAWREVELENNAIVAHVDAQRLQIFVEAVRRCRRGATESHEKDNEASCDTRHRDHLRATFRP